MQITARELIDNGPSLSVGMLTADLLRLGDELTALDEAGVKAVHVDAMDGVFCPQSTFGPTLVKALPDRFIKDVHLMIDEPLSKVSAYVDAGADILTFHVESTRHPHRVLQSLLGAGVVRGVAINPGTPVVAVQPLLDELIMVLGINPGWGGQSFIPSSEARIAEVRALVEGRTIAVAVDGGITKANIQRVASLGADLIVAGSAVYDGHAAAHNARTMLDLVRRAPPAAAA